MGFQTGAQIGADWHGKVLHIESWGQPITAIKSFLTGLSAVHDGRLMRKSMLWLTGLSHQKSPLPSMDGDLVQKFLIYDK
jgi:hypothetical protein